MNSITQTRKSARDISRFLFGQSRGGEMLQEFCASGLVDDADVRLSAVNRALIYEFSWEFVAEHYSRDHWKWNFYVQHVWRTGTVEWWEEFAAAHRLLVQPEVAGCAGVGIRARAGGLRGSDLQQHRLFQPSIRPRVDGGAAAAASVAAGTGDHI